MNTSTLRIAGFAILGWALAGSPGALAQADDPEPYGDDYQSGDYGRIRYLDGGATIVRAEGEEADAQASVNAPLFPGDRVRTDREQRVELQLSGGTTLRVDGDTELTLQSLPRPYAKYRDNTVILLDRGAIRVDARVAENDEFRIDTMAGSVYLLGDGDFRVEADPTGRTRVLSRRGVAEVVGEGGSVLVRGGSGTTLSAGTVPEDPRPYNAYASDGFDRWCESREEVYTARDRYASADFSDDDVPYEVRPYARELSNYGHWVSVPDYGWAWYPSDVGAGWRPYYDGYWDYGPHGYFWVGNEPWGWAPYRYGRWSWIGGYGWCWFPGRVFAGAWVSWSWGSLYFGWAPLDYWGRPSYIGGTHYGHYYDPGCWTFLSYQHVAVRDVRRHAVPIARTGDDVRNRPAVLRAPRVSPRQLADSRDWRERAARDAVADTRYRARPIDTADRTPGRRLRDVEDRLIQRGPRSGDSGDVRGIGSGREIRDPRRDVRPMPRVPSERATPPARVAPSGRSPGAVDRRSGAGEAAGRAPYPRRIVEDPRVDRRDSGAGRAGDEAKAPDTRRRSVAPRETNDRVRDLYDRLSRPREMRESEPRRRETAPERVAPTPRRRETAPERVAPTPRREVPRESARDSGARSRPYSAPVQRVEPRREPPRESPRVQQQPRPQQPRVQQQPRPQPRSQPRAETPRQAPKKEQPRGESKRDRR